LEVFLLELAEEAIPMMNSMCDLAAELVPTAQMLCAGRGIEIGVALLEIHILAPFKTKFLMFSS